MTPRKLKYLAAEVSNCGAAYKYLAVTVLSISVSALVFARAQAPTLPPGLRPFTPTRIDWLTTTLQADLRDDELERNGFELLITSPDSETILIFVRYQPNVNREVMNLSINTARQVIQMTAKRYGWDKWVKIREDIQLGKPS